jgi:two-component system sensor histidine kinase CpxA
VRRRRGSLYATLLLWLSLNLLLLAALFVALPGQGGLGWDMLLSKSVRERMLTIGQRIGGDLALTPASGWRQVLGAYGSEYGVAFAIGPEGPSGDLPGPRPGPPPLPPPGDAGPGPSPPPPEDGFGGTGPSPGAGPGRFQEPPDEPRRTAGLVSIVHSAPFAPYDVKIPARLARANEPARPLMILAQAGSLFALLHFLGVTEWLLFAVLAIVLSALLWWPLIWGLSHTVVRLTDATHDIAAGRFDVRVHSSRNDELGRLADAVNGMAERLQNFVSGQKQFLADIAHEVTSPLARMQLGLGILEAHVPEPARRSLRDIQDDAQQMSQLLNELLLFSRASLGVERGPPERLLLRPLLMEVLQREDSAHRVRFDIAPNAVAVGHGALLQRAVANLVRNALRFDPDQQGTVELRVIGAGDRVLIAVRDRGPGVPESALARLGEPFFRPTVARDRDSGGTGIGLAIVRRCVESCGGAVEFANRAGGGFEAIVRLPVEVRAQPAIL